MECAKVFVHRLFESYGIDSNKYKEVLVDTLGLSTRLSNCLRRVKVQTVEQLLNLSENDFESIRGFGNTTRRELEQLIGSLPKTTPKIDIHEPEKMILTDEVRPFTESIRQLLFL